MAQKPASGGQLARDARHAYRYDIQACFTE